MRLIPFDHSGHCRYLYDAVLGLPINGAILECCICAGVSVHLLNSIVAWLDIILSRPRSFSRRSQWLSIGLVVFYLHWILLCSHINGGFPYPFLNKLPQPQASPHLCSSSQRRPNFACLLPEDMKFCAGLCGRGCRGCVVILLRVSAWEICYGPLAEVQTKVLLNVSEQ